jgi:glycosyltransferase involved in cell wall biosynthesis
LSANTIETIYAGLCNRGIDKEKFVWIPWVRSLWQILIEERIDVYITSFPLGGGLASVEVMGAGIPLVVHQSYLSRFHGGADLVYPEAFSWKVSGELHQYLRGLTPQKLRQQSVFARRHYELYYSIDKLKGKLDANRIADSPEMAPLPLRQYTPDLLQRWLDQNKYLTQKVGAKITQLEDDIERLRVQLAERDIALETVLHSKETILHSRSWRMTAWLRVGGNFVRSLRPCGYIAASLSRCRQRSRQIFKRALYPLGRRLFATGFMNQCWYGGTAVSTRYTGPWLKNLVYKRIVASLNYIDRKDTSDILDSLQYSPDPTKQSRLGSGMPGGAPTGVICKTAPLADIESHLSSIAIPDDTESSSIRASFSIVTTFYQHLDCFKECAQSVASLITGADDAIEWLVINDDPLITADELLKVTGNGRWVRILSDGKNVGITRRLNQAIEMARYDWIVFLDCDDLIEPHAAKVLMFYLHRFPKCRYISSCMVDIDEKGRVLRYRKRTEGPSRLLRSGMIAGHLKAIRRDLFHDVGMLNESFDGCQDFEFALRTAFHEPILLIPDYLYRYRWHSSSQSVNLAARQSTTADSIQQKYVDEFINSKLTNTHNSNLRILGDNRVVAVTEHVSEPQSLLSRIDVHGKGIGVIRTQGIRIEMLQEAVESVISQDISTDALVVVHGNMAAYDLVAKSLVNFENNVALIHAPDVSRSRGYPLNLALHRLFDRSAYDFLFFLDDDDIVYPFFAAKMHEALNVSRADVVYAASNRRTLGRSVEMGYGLLPPSCLIAGNFIPINAYCIRFSSLIHARPVFNERIQYLEDWDFLLQLFRDRLQFVPLLDTLSEFRITADGNTITKNNPSEWTRCAVQIRESIQTICRSLGRWYLFEQLNFPEVLNRPLNQSDENLLTQTHEWIERYCPPIKSEMLAETVDSCMTPVKS